MDTSTKQVTCPRSEEWVQPTGKQLFVSIITLINWLSYLKISHVNKWLEQKENIQPQHRQQGKKEESWQK